MEASYGRGPSVDVLDLRDPTPVEIARYRPYAAINESNHVHVSEIVSWAKGVQNKCQMVECYLVLRRKRRMGDSPIAPRYRSKGTCKSR